MAEILVEQGALGADARALLEPLVQKHIELHGNDPAWSLAALSSVDSLCDALQAIAAAAKVKLLLAKKLSFKPGIWWPIRRKQRRRFV